MKHSITLAALVAITLTATSASALSYLNNFGTGVEGTEEGTVRVDESGEPVVDTSPGRSGGKGGKK